LITDFAFIDYITPALLSFFHIEWLSSNTTPLAISPLICYFRDFALIISADAITPDIIEATYFHAAEPLLFAAFRYFRFSLSPLPIIAVHYAIINRLS